MRPLGARIALGVGLLLAACSQSPEQPAPDAERSSIATAPRPISAPFPEATQVKLFVDSGQYDAEDNPVWARKEGLTLTAAQRKAFEAALRVEPMPDELAACFVPHHFFGYFDREGRKVGEISVCFCCAGVRVDPASQVAVGADEWVSADYAALEKLVRSMGEPTDIECE